MGVTCLAVGVPRRGFRPHFQQDTRRNPHSALVWGVHSVGAPPCPAPFHPFLPPCLLPSLLSCFPPLLPIFLPSFLSLLLLGLLTGDLSAAINSFYTLSCCKVNLEGECAWPAV